MILRKSFLIFVLVSTVLLVHSFAPSDSFKTMDDNGSIVKNELVKDLSLWPHVFRQSFFGQNSYYRPLVSLSFMFEYHFFGLNAFYYYLTNVFLHVILSVVVFLLLQLLLKSTHLAFFSALLFGIHPIQWEAVSNIPGRAILLSGFFVSLALLAYIKSSEKKKYYFISLVCFILGLLSKESAGALPAILVCYEYFLGEGKKGFLRYKKIVPLFVILSGYIVLRRYLGVTHLYFWNNGHEQLLASITFLNSVLMHLKLLVFPVGGLYFDRSSILFSSLLQPQAVATFIVYFIFIFLVVRFRNNISPLHRFFICVFWIELFPVSQTFVSIGVMPGYISTADHFLYLPSISFFVLLVSFCEWLVAVNKKRKVVNPAILYFAFGANLVFFGLTTVQQEIISGNEIAMFEYSLERNPHNVRIRNSLATRFAMLNQFERAEQHFRKSLEYYPSDAWALIGLGKALCDQGRLWEGLAEYEKIDDAGGLDFLLKENIRKTYVLLERQFLARARREPKNPKIYFTLGVIYSKMNKLPEAVLNYQKAVNLDAGFKDAFFNLAQVLEAQGRLQEALCAYQSFLDSGEEGHELEYHVYLRLSQIYDRLGNQLKANECRLKARDFQDTTLATITSCQDICPAD